MKSTASNVSSCTSLTISRHTNSLPTPGHGQLSTNICIPCTCALHQSRPYAIHFPVPCPLLRYAKQAPRRIKPFAATTTWPTKAVPTKIVSGDISAFSATPTPKRYQSFNAPCIPLLPPRANDSHLGAHRKPHPNRHFYPHLVSPSPQPVTPPGPYASDSHFYTLQHRCAFAQSTSTCNAAGPYAPYPHMPRPPKPHVSIITALPILYHLPGAPSTGKLPNPRTGQRRPAGPFFSCLGFPGHLERSPGFFSGPYEARVGHICIHFLASSCFLRSQA